MRIALVSKLRLENYTLPVATPWRGAQDRLPGGDAGVAL